MNRIRGYKDFLNVLIFESIIFARNDFKEFLYVLKDKDTPIKDKVNKLSYKIGDLDVRTNINYIGLSPNSNTEISFIPDSQFQRYLSSYADIKNKSKSYSNAGRAFRQLLISFEIPFNDKDIEIFVNEYKAYWDSIYSNKKFEIVKGDEILKWYLESNYSSQKSTLGNSCMKYPQRNHFMKLYAQNPDTISMCVVKEDDKISARCIIWTLENGKTYLDRIYYTEDSLVSFITDNVVKLHSKDFYSYDIGNLPQDMVVNLKKVDFERYPYADVMRYVYQKLINGKIEGSGKISNSEKLEFEGEWKIMLIQSTNGVAEDLTHKKSRSLDIYIKNEEAVYLNELDDYFRKSDLNYSNYLQTYLTKENSVYSEDIKDYIPKKEAIKHPKFGLVPKNKIFNVFGGYKIKEEPIIINNKLINGEYNDIKFIEELILDEYNIYYFFDVMFLNKDVAKDIYGSYTPKIISERIVKISDDDQNKLKRGGLECLLIIEDYILEIDAIALGIEYNDVRYADPINTISQLMIKYGKNPYLNYINNIKDEKIKKERQLKFEAYVDFLKSNSIWEISSNFEKEELINLFIKTFENAIEFGNSEKLFRINNYYNLDIYELFEYSLKWVYRSENDITSENKLFFNLYKIFLALYYITDDSYDVKRYIYNNFDKEKLEILKSYKLSGDDGLEIIREITRASYNSVFNLISQSFEVLKDIDDSISNITIDNLSIYLKKQFYSDNKELFKKLIDIN